MVASPAVDDGSTVFVADDDENLGRVKADALSWRLPTRAAVIRREGENFMVCIQMLGAEQSLSALFFHLPMAFAS